MPDLFTECEHGNLVSGELPCPQCQPKPKKWYSRETVSHTPLTAMFPGRCPECGDEIFAGERITRNEDDLWVHWGCR